MVGAGDGARDGAEDGARDGAGIVLWNRLVVFLVVVV